MKSLYVDSTQLTKDKKFTFLTADAASAATTITVQSIVGFAVGQLVCIGEIGEEDSEIVKVHASTAPSGTTVTLAAAITFAHPQDTKVYIVDWNVIEVSHASAVAGTKSTLAVIDIQADQTETLYNDTSKTSGYYFTRFRDNVDNIYSSYSDAIPYSGYGDNTVWAIKERALNSVDEVIGGVISHNFLDECLWQARREFHESPGKRPFRAIFNYDNGTATTGQFRVAVPSDLEMPYSADNLYGVKIAKQMNMDYYDKKKWDQDYEGHTWTVLAQNYTSATSVDVYVSNANNLDSSGSVKIGDDDIAYSAKNTSTGTLTVSTAGDYDHSSGDLVWNSGRGYGLPQYFTVFKDTDGTSYIGFNTPISSDYNGKNIYLDYYRTVVPKDSDADLLDEPSYDFFVNYLAYRIKKKKDPNLVAINDPDYQLWLVKKSNALKNEKLGQTIRMRPGVDHLPIN